MTAQKTAREKTSPKQLRSSFLKISTSIALIVLLVSLIGFLVQNTDPRKAKLALDTLNQTLAQGEELITNIRSKLTSDTQEQEKITKDRTGGMVVNLRDGSQVSLAGILPKIKLPNIRDLLRALNPFTLIDSARNLIESLISNGRKLWDRVFDLQLALADIAAGVGETTTSLIAQTFQATTATITNLTASSFTASGTATFSGSIGSSLIPSTDNLYDLGTGTLRFRTAYLGTSVTVGGATLNTNSLFFSGAGTVTAATLTDGTLSITGGSLSGAGTVSATTLQGDLSCTDCINATEIEDIYLFNTGDTASGNYNFDAGTLFVNAASNRIGIGTTSSNNELTVSGSADLSGNLALNGGTVNANYGIELGSWGNGARGTNLSGTLTTHNATIYGAYRTLNSGGVVISGVGNDQYLHGDYNAITLNSTSDPINFSIARGTGSVTDITFSGTLNFGGGLWNKATFTQPYNVFIGVGNGQDIDTDGLPIPISSSFDQTMMMGIASMFSLSGDGSSAYGSVSELSTSGASAFASGEASLINVSGAASTGRGLDTNVYVSGEGSDARGVYARIYTQNTDGLEQTIYGGEFVTSTDEAADIGYGVYALAGGSGTNYGIYSAAGTNYFNGSVGIGGTASPSSKLDVEANDASGYAAEFFNDGDNVNRYGIKIQAGADDGGAVGTTYYLHAYDGNGGETGNLKTVDGVFQLADISDVRLKTNITDTGLGGMEIINGLRVVDFNWLSNPQGSLQHGFIAQEAQEVFPYMVNQEESGIFTTSKGLLIPVLVKAIQEQQVQLDADGELAEINSVRIEQLSARIDALESRAGTEGGIFDHISATIAEFVSAVVDNITARVATITEAIVDRLTVKKISVEEPAVGSGTIPAGQTQVLITNSLVTDQSRIFVTTTTKTDKALSVTEKVAGTSFTIEIAEPAEAAISFDYWIVN